MNELIQNNRKIQTEITDTKSLKNIWLGRKDLNLRSPAPEAGALPLGHSPLNKYFLTLCGKVRLGKLRLPTKFHL